MHCVRLSRLQRRVMWHPVVDGVFEPLSRGCLYMCSVAPGFISQLAVLLSRGEGEGWLLRVETGQGQGGG